jgi:Type IV secretion-system coupling protein DNA-binding domain
MKHSTEIGGPPSVDKFSGVADLTSLLLAGVTCGTATGFALALHLRRRGLTWGWGALSLPLLFVCLLICASGVLPMRLGLTISAWAAGLSFGALGFGIHGELEDRRAGGDRAAEAQERRRVLDRARHRGLSGMKGAAERLVEGVPLGRTRRDELAVISRGSADSGRHVLIPGASGTGKTTSLAALLVDYVARSNFGAIVLEAKTDRTLLQSARAAAVATATPFHFLSPEGPGIYDPLRHGSVDERSERLIAVEEWGSTDAGFYRQAASPFLRLVIRTLDRSSERVTLRSVAEYCDPDQLENLALEHCDGGEAGEVSLSVRGLRSDQQRAIAGLRARLQNLASSEFASSWLDPERASGTPFDLRKVIERREVAYFRFDTDRTGNVGRAIAQMVLLDLGAAASALMGDGVGTFIAIDEFGALEASALDRLYARGRAAGFSVAVGTQTLADLRAAGPAVRERVGATISSLVCHRIGEQADAEWVAQLIGAVPTWQSTIRTNGFGRATAEGTRTRGYRFEVNPSELQRLDQGDAFIARLDQSATTRARRVQVVPPWKRLSNMGATP